MLSSPPHLIISNLCFHILKLNRRAKFISLFIPIPGTVGKQAGRCRQFKLTKIEHHAIQFRQGGDKLGHFEQRFNLRENGPTYHVIGYVTAEVKFIKIILTVLLQIDFQTNPSPL